MLATLAAWFASQGASLLLGAAVQLISDLWKNYKAEQALKDLGAVQSQLAQATATITAQQDMLQAQADAPKTTSDAIKRLRDGSA